MPLIRTALQSMSLLLAAAALVACEPATPPSTGGGDTTSSGGETVAADPWGPMPKTVEPNYFTDFEEWIGKPLASQPLARIMTRPIPEFLKTGRGFVMYYRADCEHCHHMLEQWFTESVPGPTVAVEVPDTDPADAMPFPSTLVERRKFPKGPNYVISTPALFAIKDGIVTGFASDPDDADAVEACLSSNAD
ncbi:MAG: hypothetical protein RLZZ461_1195 [Planctomycetota bacterium]|jgi:hypothetical protein